MRQTDVLVIGGGPAGMTAAGEVARAGGRVTVLERRPEINPASRAFATMPRTLELLDSRGLADGLVAGGARISTVRPFGNAVVRLDAVDSAFPFALIRPQAGVDAHLSRYADAQGAEVRRGVDVVELSQDADGVTVTSRDGETWRARYLVAADGAHSTVRSLVGLPFPGRTVLRSMALADVRLTAGPPESGLRMGDRQGLFAFLANYDRPDPAGGGWYRSMTWDRHHVLPEEVPVDRAEVAEVLRRALGHDVGVAEIGWSSRFHSDERQVPRYRVGRVLLVGDSAHVHSPAGGQGMNTGIQDSFNLGWKLAAVLAGADDALLDSYHAERHPVGRRVVHQSGMLLRAIVPRHRWSRALRNVGAPRALAIPAVERYAAATLAGTRMRYPGRGPVGTRASRVPLAEGRLEVLQRGTDFVLVLAAGAPAVSGIVTARRTDGGPSALVRPDGYVAWAGGPLDPGDPGWRDVRDAWLAPRRSAQAASASS